jgi:hypothetical protein
MFTGKRGRETHCFRTRVTPCDHTLLERTLGVRRPTCSCCAQSRCARRQRPQLGRSERVGSCRGLRTACRAAAQPAQCSRWRRGCSRGLVSLSVAAAAAARREGAARALGERVAQRGDVAEPQWRARAAARMALATAREQAWRGRRSCAPRAPWHRNIAGGGQSHIGPAEAMH